MKKIFLAATIALFIAASASAKDHTPKNKSVSYRAQEIFPFDFQNAQDVSWKTTGEFSEAAFLQNGTAMKAYYDWEGNLVGTTTHIPYATLPLSSRKAIEKRYKDYSVQNAILYKDNENNENDLYPLIPEESDINYFVSLTENTTGKEVILQVTPDGQTSFFENMPKE